MWSMYRLWLPILLLSLPGCGRDWSLPSFNDYSQCSTDADCDSSR
jgi:hypothetical protein